MFRLIKFGHLKDSHRSIPRDCKCCHDTAVLFRPLIRTRPREVKLSKFRNAFLRGTIDRLAEVSIQISEVARFLNFEKHLGLGYLVER